MGKVYHRYTFCPTLRTGTFMKRHFIQSLLVTSIALTLAACGSSGSSETKPVVVENKPVENKPVENKPVENKPVENKPVENKPVEEKISLIIETPDGAKIDLSDKALGKISGEKTAYGELTGQHNEYSFYGLWKGNDGSSVLHYQGIEATDVPVSGKATYTGDAVWVSGLAGAASTGLLNMAIGSQIPGGNLVGKFLGIPSGFDVAGKVRHSGKTTLNVDFGQKTVDGSITFSVFNGDEFRRDITLQKTKLDGSKFSGKAEAGVFFNDVGTYEGALYGKGAPEAAGRVHFKDRADLDVVFGGKRSSVK